MTSSRRRGPENSATREQLLDAAEQVMREEGYPAVTTRRLASHLGVSNQLVHYYFRTMDELFIALMQRGADRSIGRLIEAFASDDPIQALRAVYGDPDFSILAVELMALANHRKAVRAEVIRYAQRLRDFETKGLARFLADRGLSPEQFPAAGVAIALSGLPRVMAIEAALGLTVGHSEANGIVENFLHDWSDRLQRPT
jgi:AcrR family transcriptional regulator